MDTELFEIAIRGRSRNAILPMDENLRGSRLKIWTPPSEPNEIVLPQNVVGPLTRAAIFLVVCIRQDEDAYAELRAFCADLSGLIRAVEFRDVEAGLTCVAGFGSDAWDKLFGAPRPAELHPFREIRSGGRHAVSTPGDILLPHSSQTHGPVLRIGHADHGEYRRRGLRGGRGARLPLFRRPRCHGLRRRHGESARRGGARGGDRRR